jgi:hypothetical protein
VTPALRRLGFVHLVANAFLLGFGYFWLGISDARGSALALSVLIGLVLLTLACSTYGATFAFFGAVERKVLPAWKTAARNLLPLAVAAVAIALLYWLLALIQDYSSDPAFTLASYLTLTFRKPVTPASISKVFGGVLTLVRWVILPVVLLPLLSAIATQGWPGFKARGTSGGAGARTWWYWLAAPLLLLAAIEGPLKLLTWTPRTGSFGMEAVSFLLRAALAYLLFGAAWLALAFATSAGKPRFTQSNTAVSP